MVRSLGLTEDFSIALCVYHCYMVKQELQIIDSVEVRTEPKGSAGHRLRIMTAMHIAYEIPANDRQQIPT